MDSTPPGAGVLFQHFLDGRPRTKAELAEATSMARSTVTARLDALLASGLLVPYVEPIATGGRPAASFTVDWGARAVLGVDLGASHRTVALTDLRGRVLVERSERIDITAGPERTLADVIVSGTELLAEAGVPADRLAGVGIGLPGPVDVATGRPSQPPIMPGWDSFDVRGVLAAGFPSAVVAVDNDVNLMVLGEREEHWPETDDMVFIKVATGIGSGIIARGRLVRGAQGTAGDLGHVQVQGSSGALCRCGNLDCLEAIAAAPAIAADLRAAGLRARTSAEVVAAVQRGDAAALRRLRQAGRDIGTVLASCVSLLNPSVIVIGGQLAEVGELLLSGVREVVFGRSLPLATAGLQVVRSRAGARAGVLGASALVRHDVLSADAVDELLAAHTGPLAGAAG